MRDAISIARVKLLHPAVRDEVARLIGAIEATWPVNMAIRIVQGLRTIDEQNALYAQGRTKPGNKVTNAKGGSSYHNYGLAVDFALLYDKDGNGSYETLS
jgi:peptidoglycan L-alanyl-D-glutamate endopeptidase CwlK